MSGGPGPTLTKIPGSAHVFFCFDLILYIPFNKFSVISGRVFLGLTSTKQRVMCFAQGHNALNAVVPVRLKLESLGLESSTLALSHFRFFITTVHLHMVDVLPYVLNKKKKAYTECSSANMHIHVCLYHSCHRILKTEDQDPS